MIFAFLHGDDGLSGQGNGRALSSVGRRRRKYHLQQGKSQKKLMDRVRGLEPLSVFAEQNWADASFQPLKIRKYSLRSAPCLSPVLLRENCEAPVSRQFSSDFCAQRTPLGWRPASEAGQKAPKRGAHRRQVFKSPHPKEGNEEAPVRRTGASSYGCRISRHGAPQAQIAKPAFTGAAVCRRQRLSIIWRPADRRRRPPAKCRQIRSSPAACPPPLGSWNRCRNRR